MSQGVGQDNDGDLDRIPNTEYASERRRQETREKNLQEWDDGGGNPCKLVDLINQGDNLLKAVEATRRFWDLAGLTGDSSLRERTPTAPHE